MSIIVEIGGFSGRLIVDSNAFSPIGSGVQDQLEALSLPSIPNVLPTSADSSIIQNDQFCQQCSGRQSYTGSNIHDTDGSPPAKQIKFEVKPQDRSTCAFMNGGIIKKDII